MADAGRILVTGANGFIGRACLPPLLDRGFEVIAPYIGEPAADAGAPVQWAPCDLASPDAVRAVVREARATHLLHLAWPVDPHDVYNGPESFRAVGMSLEVFRAFADAGGRRAVVAGSCAEYDWNEPVLHETRTPRRPNSVYGMCKHHLHGLMDLFAERAGLELAWPHIFFLYGPHESPRRLVPYAINALLDGVPAEFTPGNQIRDFLHVHDLGRALAALAASPVTGPINIASGDPRPVRDLLQIIGEELGRPDLIRLGARPMPAHETLRLEADVTRARTELDWRPRFALRDGLRHTIDWWREHHQ